MQVAERKTVLSFMAHPDDMEFLCAGTLIRLHSEAECRIAIATATSGDGGSTEHGPADIARIRHNEAKAAADLLGAPYDCAGCADLLVTYDRPTIRRFVEIVRAARPDIVITHSPADYMVDHEMTSRLVRAACFAASVPNVLSGAIEPAPPCDGIPHLYYADPVEGKDPLGQDVEPTFIVDISAVIEAKEQMLACHASQREWLRAQHGMDEYIISMKEWSATRGKQIGKPYAEGFRQHLGHAYPQDNIITELLRE